MRRRRPSEARAEVSAAAPGPRSPLRTSRVAESAASSDTSAAMGLSGGGVHGGAHGHHHHHSGSGGDSVEPAPSARSAFVRFASGVAMLSAFVYLIVALRQLGVVALIFALQFGMYREIVHVATVEARERSLPGFSLFYFYWFAVAAFYSYARTLQPFLTSALTETPVLRGPSGLPKGWLGSARPSPAEAAAIAAAAAAVVDEGPTALQLGRAALRVVVEQHVPIAFALYCLGLVLFVVSLRRRRNFRYQFAQMAYCHVALLVIVSQSTLLAANSFSGLLWVTLPTGMVIANDSFSFIAGRLFGRTPLIRLSPKKTVEGFVGGAIATVLFALLWTSMAQSVELFGFRYLMLCPVETGLGTSINHCDVDAIAGGIFVPRAPVSYRGALGSAAAMLLPRAWAERAWLSPAALHACCMAVFASLIAPFGGFLASGFKRARNIKDFASLIPGHGGLTDRMDCQLLMGAFAYVYTHHLLKLGSEGFAGGVGVARHFSAITGSLRPQDIAALVEQLQAYLRELSDASGAGR